MNEWGIPRWCEPSAYGDTKRWTLARWHWEFTRRRDDYRAETLTYLTLQREVEAARKRMKENPAPEARCAWETLSAQADKLWNRHWRKWGYSAPLDPSVSEFPQDDLLRWPHGGVTSMRGSHVGRAPELRNTLTPTPEELAVTINLNRPIAEQIKLVERVAKREQKELHGRLVQKRRHPVKWLGYLRTLDAREALPNASWQEFTEALFGADLVERHTDPAGGYRAPPPQAGRDKWEAANALRFNF